MINLTNARLMRGEQTLLENANLTLHKGHKVGVIGRNGSGKSSLFACLNGQLQLDAGDLSMPESLRIAWMKQETAGSHRSAIDHVIDGDNQLRQIEASLAEAEQAGDGHQIAKLHADMDRIDGYNAQVRAEQLLSGLGFSTEEFAKPVGDFSGGWRIRLNLAAALMAPSDLLLLDEPTNHLDLQATLWLEQWLNRYTGTLLIISHDRSFLDSVIGGVVSFEGKQLFEYRGNYTSFEKQRAERLAQQQAALEKQMRRRSEIEDFVRRFRAKASKAKQAQSRLKELERMQDIAPAHSDSPFRFTFFSPEQSAENLLSLKKAAIGFDTPLVTGINLKLHQHTRIGLLGRNGMGKSTLLKTLAGQLHWKHAENEGEVIASKHLKIGYFAQHQVDEIDLSLSPIALIQKIDPTAREQELRNFLGGFDFRGDRISEPAYHFSGGEKSRLALSLIVWQKPNVLLLDEPSNHLDMEMRHALTVALQGFDGAIILVSHDRHLMGNTVDEFLLIDQGKCQVFEGDLHEYESWLQQDSTNSSSGTGKAKTELSGSPGMTASAKENRQQAAMQRQQTGPLRKEIRALEKSMGKLTDSLKVLEEKLADPGIYDEARKNELKDLLAKQGEQQSELERIEEAWLEKSAELESV